MCVPSCAQAAAHSGVHVNERNQTSTTAFREIEADKAFPGMLDQLCTSGKHIFPVKECGRGATRQMWTLADAKLRPEIARRGTVYRQFKSTLAATRNVLNPLYIALCVKGAKGELMLPSGWQKQDMIDAIKYNLANGSKVDEELDSEPLGAPILESTGSTEAGQERAESSTEGGVGAQPGIGEVDLDTAAMASNSPAKLAAGDVLMRMMAVAPSVSPDTGPATPPSDPEYTLSQSSSQEEEGEGEEEVVQNKTPPPTHTHTPAAPLSPRPPLP